MAIVGGLAGIATSLGGAAAANAATTPTLLVDAGSALRPVTHVASGGLYGLATDSLPSEDVVAALNPNTFVQMAPDGGQLPNGETAPGGDVLQVLKLAHEVGAKVVVRMPDWFPTFPYSASGPMTLSAWDAEVDTQIALVENSPYASSVAAWAPWNEPDANWTGSITADDGTPLNFNTFWQNTYNEIRKDDPNAVIQGPSFSQFGNRTCTPAQEASTRGADCGSIQAFLQFAQSTSTVPNIIAWHELSGEPRIAGDVATYRSYEISAIGHTLPIAIEEYGEPSEVGIPGDMAGYIAKFERTGVHDAEIAFWNEYGSFGDTLTGTGGSPNGAYWLYKWYADMTGNMLTTTPTNLPVNSNFDGFASATADGRKLSVVFGGNTGAEQVTLNNLNALNLGNQVNVSVQYVPSRGRTAPVAGPLTLSNTTESVTDGTLTVPINSLSAADGYRIVVTPAVQAPADLSGTYKLGNLGSGLDLTPVDNSGKAGTAVEQDSSRGNSNQQWTVKSVGSGNYTIQNDGKGLFLGTDSTANGAGVTLQESASAADDQWQLTPDGRGNVSITNAGTGLPLGIADRSTAQSAAAIQTAAGVPTPVCTATQNRTAGVFGNAVSLCGDGEFVNLPKNIVQGITGDWSISAWIRPQSNTMWSRVFDFGTGTTDYMYLTVDNAGGDLRFAMSTNGPGAEQGINSSFPIDQFGQDNNPFPVGQIGTSSSSTFAPSFANSSAALLPLDKWSLVTVTVSGTTGTLYVNGTAVGNNTDITLHPSSLGPTTQDWLGRSEFGDPFFHGAIDDVNIYNTALTAAQITAMATGATPGNGNVADYTFNEATGPAAADSSGNGQTATIVSAPTQTSANSPHVPGEIGNALQLNGNGEYVQLPNGIVSGLHDFTISTWVNPSANLPWSRIFDFGNGTNDFMFMTLSAGGGPLIFSDATPTNPGQTLTAPGQLPLNTWSHVAVTLSGTTGTLYVDGKAVATNNNMVVNPSDLGVTTQNWIGHSQFSADPFLAATVDDFQIYDHALSASDIAALASGQAGAGNVADYKFDEASGTTAVDSSGNGNNATIFLSPTAEVGASDDQFWQLDQATSK